ncbi:hypothetical protein CTheo_4908 [Ceratobasidium theobromae]|uniref:Uncharacterized protein n=1 Tax=Ceratobasidium theobromae TaxID=1582974 RepID=A0A5N5QJM1_9AGAM|nr:hypothetical protein CTheo_4908 [Ceratobasidium theobromae]
MLWNNDILCRLGEGHHVLDICDVIAFAPPTSLPCFSALSLPPPSGKWGQRFHDVHIELPPRGPIQRPQHIPDDPPNARLHPARPQTELGQAFSSSAGQISVVAQLQTANGHWPVPRRPGACKISRGAPADTQSTGAMSARAQAPRWGNSPGAHPLTLPVIAPPVKCNR